MKEVTKEYLLNKGFSILSDTPTLYAITVKEKGVYLVISSSNAVWIEYADQDDSASVGIGTYNYQEQIDSLLSILNSCK